MCSHHSQTTLQNFPVKKFGGLVKLRYLCTRKIAKAGFEMPKRHCEKIFFKKSVKNLHSSNIGSNFASLSAREEMYFP